MRNLPIFLVLVLVLCHGLSMTMGESHTNRAEENRGRSFLMRDSKPVVKTDAGHMRVVRSPVSRTTMDRPMHIGFITMDPNSLFTPQYTDSNLVIFVKIGSARVGSINDKDQKLVETDLKAGDVYQIQAGSSFYLMNTEERMRLRMVLSIDPSQSSGLGSGLFKSLRSVLSGFGFEALTTALNVSKSEVHALLTKQKESPIVHLSNSQSGNKWSNFLQMEEQDKVKHMKSIVEFQVQQPKEEEKKQEQVTSWSWRKLLKSVFESENNQNQLKSSSSSSSNKYNLYSTSPDFKNNYGYSISVGQSDYSPLKQSNIGLYYVNLTAGSMMAPHVNPTATEYGIVVKGSGSLQIVFPNGSLAMDARLKQGDVFRVPRYFPVCQIASVDGSLEFMGFTTSAHNNRPQFLAGASSLLHSLPNAELADAFGVSEDRVKAIVNAQTESVILPRASSSSPQDKKMKKRRKSKKLSKVMIKSLDDDMIMGFD